MQEDNIVWYLTDGYWEENGHRRHSFDVQPGGTLAVNITALTQEGQQLARWALESWSLITGIRFQEVTYNAQIMFDNDGDWAETSAWWDWSGNMTRAEVNIPVWWDASGGSGPGSYRLTTYIHEIGHALGLGHSGNYNAGAGTELVTFEDATFETDVTSLTVMSYFGNPENPSFRHLDNTMPASPMLVDILAMAVLYGVPENVNEGNTWYGYRSNTGTYLDDVFLELVGNEYPGNYYRNVPDISLTIVDTGGVDWVDFRTDTRDQFIDLAPPESELDIDMALFVVYGSKPILIVGQIEHVIAGNGSDYIEGNSYGNKIYGLSGSDEIYGKGGNDLIYGYSGNDTIYGGDGDDRIIGGWNSDRMEGGTGDDVFVFRPMDGAVSDTVLDFTKGEDRIDLSEFDTIHSVNDLGYYYYDESRESAFLYLADHGGGKIILWDYVGPIGDADFIFTDDVMVA